MNDHRPVEPITVADRDEPLRASLAQQRLFFLSRLDGADRAYHVHCGLRLRGALHREALIDALDLIVRRHEVLRTTFRQVEGAAYQSIHDTARMQMQQHDLDGREDAGEQLRAIVAQEASEAFDLERGPLIRGRLIRMAEDEHALLITMHHIVSDAWSMGILTTELGALYHALSRHLENPLPPLRIQYVDHAEWQHRRLQAEGFDRHMHYWRNTLADAPTKIDLPGDRPRPPLQNYRGGSVDIRLDAHLVAELRVLSRDHGISLFTALFAGWSILLFRLTHQSCMLIGSPTANRLRKELEGLIGFFVNMLVLRVDITPGLSVSQLLRRTGERVLHAQQHADVPFEHIVEALKPPRSLSHTPLFQTMFVWQSVPRGHLGLPSLSIEPLNVPGDTAQFDLTLSLGELGDHILGTMNYARDLFDEDTIARWTSAYETVLRQIVRDPQGRVDAVTLLDARSRREVVETFNATERAYAGVELVHAGFEAQAARTPDAIAAMDEDGQVSYAELNRRANRLARYLRTCGVGPEGRVAVSVARGVPLVVCLLATLKAGGAYVPLDPGYPPARLAEMLADSRPAVVLQASGTEVPVTAAGSARCVWVDRDAQRWSGLSGADLEAEGLTPAHLAYVIYTSGSTGRPKGVMNAHRGVANRLRWMQEAYGLRAGEAVLQKTPCSFDVSVWEFYWPLLAGAKLVLARAEGHRDPGYLREVIEQEGIGTLHFVPSMLGAFLQEVSGGCGSLVRVFCSGEALPRAAVERFAAQWPQVGLHNLYGPTEAAVDVTAYACAGLPAQGEVPIGAPIANVRIYVLDGRGEPVPVGVSGEVHIGGVAVARGYWSRPALTAERFVADGCGVEAGARLYRTGDLGRWRKDGTIEYLGRNDDQVKLRGYRIELGEIEARLREHAQVREAAVVMRDDGAQARLVGYVTGFDAQAPEVDALRAHLQARLPGYMVPSVLVVLEAMPLAPNGKLDRRALPMPEGQAHPGRRYEAPQGEREQALAQIWQELLKVPRVGRHDHFFDLGGHSLLAMRLIERARRQGIDIALTILFENPVLSALAARVTPTPERPLPPCIVRIREGANAGPLFLVHDVSGDISAYLHLAGMLPDGCAIYGVQARASDADYQASIGAMAERYVGAIREVQTDGHYRLAGWSLGGTIAHEMARQLESSGQTVDFVGLVDSRPLEGALSAHAPEDWELWNLGGVPENPTRREKRRDEPPDCDIIAMRRRLFEAGKTHAAKAINARIRYLYASASMDMTQALAYGRQLGSDLTVTEVDGDHWTIMAPLRAAAVAEALAAGMCESTLAPQGHSTNLMQQ